MRFGWMHSTFSTCGESQPSRRRGPAGGADLECAAADRVRLVLVLLVARPQRQAIDEVQRRAHLPLLRILRRPVRPILLADAIDVLLQLPGLLVLRHVVLALEGAVRRQEHVLEVLGRYGILPERQPGHGVVVADGLPGLSRIGVLRDRRVRADVDRDVPRVDAPLDAPHLRMLPASAEQTRGLHAKVANLRGIGHGRSRDPSDAHLLRLSVDEGRLVPLLRLLLP